MGLISMAKWLASQVFDAQDELDADLHDDPHGLVDLQVGKRVFNDAPASMRTELWLSQLHREGGRGAAAARQYSALLRKPLATEVRAEIAKDTHRTFPGHQWLSSRAGQDALERVLCAYAAHDPTVGYAQGMNFLAGLLLAYLPREADAFGALALVMEDRGLRDLYTPDMGLLQVRLWQLGRLLPSRLCDHLEGHAALPVLYASSWLLTCFAADFPLSFAARVMDLVLTDCYAAPMMKVAVGILRRCEPALLEMGDMEDMVDHIRTAVPAWPKPVLQDLLTEALSRPWSPRQLRVLERINGAESVADAVVRVAALSNRPTECAEAPTEAPSVQPGGATEATARDAALAAALAGLAANEASAAQRAPSGAAWEQLHSTELASLPSSRVRIETDIGAHVCLEERMSMALSSLLDAAPGHALSRSGSSRAPVPPCATGPAAPLPPSRLAPPPARRPSQQQQQQSPTPHTPPLRLSPFESPPARGGQQGPPRALSMSSDDGFGQFQAAESAEPAAPAPAPPAMPELAPGGTAAALLRAAAQHSRHARGVSAVPSLPSSTAPFLLEGSAGLAALGTGGAPSWLPASQSVPGGSALEATPEATAVEQRADPSKSSSFGSWTTASVAPCSSFRLGAPLAPNLSAGCLSDGSGSESSFGSAAGGLARSESSPAASGRTPPHSGTPGGPPGRQMAAHGALQLDQLEGFARSAAAAAERGFQPSPGRPAAAGAVQPGGTKSG